MLSKCITADPSLDPGEIYAALMSWKLADMPSLVIFHFEREERVSQRFSYGVALRRIPPEQMT